MLALDPDIAWQPAQPFRGEATPHYQTYKRCDHTNDHNELAQVAHNLRSENEHKAHIGCNETPLHPG